VHLYDSSAPASSGRKAEIYPRAAEDSDSPQASPSVPPPSVAPSSQLVRRREDGGDRAALSRAAGFGHEYLAWAAEGRGVQSVIGLDACFDRTLDPRDLRAFVRSRSGADIGFDAGDEGFSSMILLKLFGDDHAARGAAATSHAVVRRQAVGHRYRFFCEENGFAADTDCTGVAVAALYEAGRMSREELLAAGRELLLAAAPADVPATANLDAATGQSNGALRAGVVMVYWEDGQEPGALPRGRKHDAAVAANALYALKLAAEVGLADPRGVLAATLAYVGEALRSGAYLSGTRYYPAPDTFLYYVSCLCRRFPDCRAALAADLGRALDARRLAAPSPGTAADPSAPLNLAQRVLAAANLGRLDGLRWDLDDLLASQLSDGSWPAAPFYALGKRALYFGSPAVTTMFVVKAITSGLRLTRPAAAPAPVTRRRTA
jgi:hypothetical protein